MYDLCHLCRKIYKPETFRRSIILNQKYVYFPSLMMSKKESKLYMQHSISKSKKC